MYSPFLRPLYVMLKPIGARCNLACKYCYYTDKADRYRQSMDDGLLEHFIRDYIAMQPTDDVVFTWHGGEPTLLSLDFFRKATHWQRQYAGGKHIYNSLQTNGTLLNEEWCQFLKQEGWLVGISIDGPEALHDAYRKSHGGGKTHQQVVRTIKMLQEYNVEWNAMAVVNDQNADHPQEFYQFFKELGCKYLQFTPIVERSADGTIEPYSVKAEQWGRFLCGVFDEWVKQDVGRLFVQLFDATLANWIGRQPGVCTMAETCGTALVMEQNGDIYSCDHFVAPSYYLGNIRHHTLVEMAFGTKQQDFGLQKKKGLSSQCKACQYLFACHGECPKNRDVNGNNYLCKGYEMFFRHCTPYMDYMRQELLAGRAPANVMTAQIAS